MNFVFLKLFIESITVDLDIQCSASISGHIVKYDASKKAPYVDCGAHPFLIEHISHRVHAPPLSPYFGDECLHLESVTIQCASGWVIMYV